MYDDNLDDGKILWILMNFNKHFGNAKVNLSAVNILGL